MSDEQQPQPPKSSDQPANPPTDQQPQTSPNGGSEGAQQQGGGRRFDRNRRGGGGGGGRNPRGRRPFRNNRQENKGDRGGDQAGQGGQGDHGPGPDEFAEPAPGETPVQDGPPPEPTYAEGVVEVSGKGFGFLREAKRAYSATQNDIFITPEVIRQHNLRDGVFIKGETRRGPRGIQLFRATEIEGEDPAKYVNIPLFEELTTISPNQRIKLETVPERFTTRVIDLMTPVGKGQRGLIVAPPRTGKTTLLQHIADAVVKNHPEMKLIILLVDERPEEVTALRQLQRQ
jgi:transcription termination factor Rho